MAWRGFGSTHHGSNNSTRTIRRDCEVEIGDLHNVVHVEPNVPKDRLVEATMEYGLVPPVLIEFSGITAGDGFAGTAGKFPGVKAARKDKRLQVEMSVALLNCVLALTASRLMTILKSSYGRRTPNFRYKQSVNCNSRVLAAFQRPIEPCYLQLYEGLRSNLHLIRTETSRQSPGEECVTAVVELRSVLVEPECDQLVLSLGFRRCLLTKHFQHVVERIYLKQSFKRQMLGSRWTLLRSERPFPSHGV